MEEKGAESRSQPSPRERRSSRRQLLGIVTVTGISIAVIIIAFVQRLMAS